MSERTLPDQERMFRAFLERDSRFEGVFYTGVKTTGVFCRPTCRARKPKRENVVFFGSTKEALDHGFRPCKVCTPMQAPGETPDWITGLLSEIEESDTLRVRDQELREKGFDPVALRRWFKKTHGVTFHGYLRQRRINRAYGTLRTASPVIESAFDSGYESLSGFSEAFKKQTGFAPGESPKRHVVNLTRLTTPLGPMVAGVHDGALVLLEFADRPMLETQLKRIHRRYSARLLSGGDPLFVTVQRELDEYFEGDRREFTVPLDLAGTPFQEAVWSVLRNIPYGETRSYADQALALGKPKAVRAVARANGDNRIAIIIPCHRVIGKDGAMVGYGGGVWRKQYLLELEGRE